MSPRALTKRQEAAFDLLVDLVEGAGQPGPWADHEPAIPMDLWRTKLRTLFPDHANARQMVRRIMRTLIDTGVVLECDDMVCVGNFTINIEVVK